MGTNLAGKSLERKWDALGGILFANIQNADVPPICHKNTADFLHWKIIQFDFEQLTIVGEEITYPQEGLFGMGELCLFIGKRQDDPDLAVQGYLVSPEEVSKVTFSEIGNIVEERRKRGMGTYSKKRHVILQLSLILAISRYTQTEI